jgi:hypothetical protein
LCPLGTKAFFKLSLQDSGGKADLARQDGEAVRPVLLRLYYVFSTVVAVGILFYKSRADEKMRWFFGPDNFFPSSILEKIRVE